MTRIELNAAQQAAAVALGGRVLISAGAGSGKTRVLTERSANAVIGVPGSDWPGIGIDQLLAITFTEKAAGELAERVRGALRAAGRHEDARQVDAAWISTIHGMCARILRAGALEARLDPGFAVLEPVEAGHLRQQAFEEAATEALGTDPGAARLFTFYGFESTSCAASALADGARIAGLAATDLAVADAGDARSLLADAIAVFADSAGELRSLGREGDPAHVHCVRCGGTAAALQALDSRLSEDELVEALWNIVVEHDTSGRHAGVTQQVKDLKDRRNELLQRAAALMTAGPARSLLRLTDAFSRRYAALKRERGVLDFDDLQIETVRYLDEGHRDEWARRFALTMVDEFQDTDALQLGLVERLAGENLCTVGDERQSIYGFRGANVSVYRRHREEMIARGAPDVRLQVNYRSHADILDFVNKVFGASHMFGGDLVELEAGRREPERPVVGAGDVRVEVLFAGKGNGTSAADARTVLSGAIAARLAKLHAERGVPAGDMVVLLRSYTHAEEYAEALRLHGLDAIVVGGSRFFSRPEVHAVRAFVRLMANGRDEEALGLVLCSGMCRLSDDGLMLTREVADEQRVPLWDALGIADYESADRLRARRLCAAVSAARARLGSMPLAEILLRATEETGLDARLLSEGLQGGEAYANVLKLVRLAYAFEAQDDGGPAAFTAFLDAKERYGDHEAPAPLVRDGSDAVRIMSIHASKGLEFPVVVVPELGEHVGGSRGFALWELEDRPRVSLKLPSSWGKDEHRQPPTFTALSDKAKLADAEEAKRLQYVAFTRAEDMLILAGSASLSPTSKEQTPLRSVLDALGIKPEPGLDRELAGGVAPRCRVRDVGADEVQPRQADKRSDASDEAGQLAWLEAIGTESAHTPVLLPTPRRFSYSGLKAFERCPRRFHLERVLRLGTRLPAGVSATDFGSAFHAAAEAFGETSPVDDARLAAIAQYHGLDDRGAGRLRAALDAHRASPVARRVREYRVVRREAAFAIQVGEASTGFVLDGSIDLYAYDGERALIVDYKTGMSRLSDEDARDAFELQARCYALAAARDGRTSIEVIFVRPEGGSEIVFRFGPGDARETESALIRLYQRIGAGDTSASLPAGADGCIGCPASESCSH